MPNPVNNSMKIITLIMGILAASSFSAVESRPDTTVQSLICNLNSYSPNGPFASSVAYVLADLTNVTPTQQGYNYYTVSPFKPIAYGHATCSVKLGNSECVSCLIAARGDVSRFCANRIGGQVTMVDCSMRYENYAFA
ncbi:antifungal protein ginkbilobin-like protein [Primulina tabacum]|uniref:antifungal protein ginkbilobin-like protein n=1 Tax=Primulina tabacum TaxID=48773 RepID=UPI003F594C8D